jgi:hypothetical protein
VTIEACQTLVQRVNSWRCRSGTVESQASFIQVPLSRRVRIRNMLTSVVPAPHRRTRRVLRQQLEIGKSTAARPPLRSNPTARLGNRPIAQSFARRREQLHGLTRIETFDKYKCVPSSSKCRTQFGRPEELFSERPSVENAHWHAHRHGHPGVARGFRVSQ